MPKKKYTKTQTKRLLEQARRALGNLLINKIATGDGPMSIPSLLEIGKKLDSALKRIK
jgi:hypothetical protein